MAIVDQINQWVRFRNWTQRETARRLGISSTHMSDILRGKRRISTRIAVRMERVLGLDAGRILHKQLEEELRVARRRWGE